jgi:hypothetical protein
MMTFQRNLVPSVNTETASSSDTSVLNFHTKWRDIPQDRTPLQQPGEYYKECVSTMTWT